MASTRPSDFRPPATNGLGIAGFITSLIGLLLTCGTLNFISLPLSLAALLRRPRGFAIAGTLISLVGVGGWFLAGAAFIGGLMGLKADAQRKDQEMTTKTVAAEAMNVIEKYRAENHGQTPDGIEGNKLIVDKKDAWGESILYEEHDGKYVLRSAGADKKLNTDDDLTWNGGEKEVETEILIDAPDGSGGDGPVIIPTDGSKPAEAPSIELPE